jgi:hypothetical protein
MTLDIAVNHLREIIHGAIRGDCAVVPPKECISAKGDGNALIMVGCSAGNKEKGEYYPQK